MANDYCGRLTTTIATTQWVFVSAVILMFSAMLMANGQDILRQRLMPQSQAQQQQSQQATSISNQNQNLPDLSQFADIKLPPQLASLSPEQLLQLAKIRELQIRQQQIQKQQQMNANQSNQNSNNNRNNNNYNNNNNNNQQATPRPSATNNGQIPQPSSAQPIAPATPATPSIATSSKPSIEDGSYKESESEMEGVVRPENDGNNQATSNQQRAHEPSSGPADHNSAVPTSTSNQQAPSFEVNWNKCPQLEPSESEKGKKTQVITKCLQNAPIPTNLTRENVETHREQIATCALKVEGWFDDQGNYKYDKAEAEIRAKKLEGQIELQVLKFHVACKAEAQNKFPRQQHKLIEQVQFYQACMDYYISIVCEIEVSVDQ